MRPIHPGEILFEEFMKPLGLSANQLSKLIHVPANRVSSIVNGSRNVTADTALRLGVVFGTTPQFWMNLQQTYELRVEETRPETKVEMKTIKPVVKAAPPAKHVRAAK
jgi:addiction module HigA family antidote